MQFGTKTLEEWALSLRPAEAPSEAGPPESLDSLDKHAPTPAESGPNLTSSTHELIQPEPNPVQHSTKPVNPSKPAPQPPRSNNSSFNERHVTAPVAAVAATPRANGASMTPPKPAEMVTAAPKRPMSWAKIAAATRPNYVAVSKVNPITIRAPTPFVQPRITRATLPPLPPRRIRGLINAGNTCFVNVCLQALISCDPFRRYLLSLRDNPSNPPLVSNFIKLAVEMSVLDCQSKPVASRQEQQTSKHVPNLDEPIMPDWSHEIFPGSNPAHDSLSEPKSNGTLYNGRRPGSQEDAEEFLMYVLNKLHDELVSVAGSKDAKEDGWHKVNGANGSAMHARAERSKKGAENGGGEWQEISRRGRAVQVRETPTENSPITELFGGQLRHELKRAYGQTNVNKEPYLSLQLGIESGLIRNVVDALVDVFRVEHLEPDVASKYQSNMKKQILLDSIPQVLILHVKRFSSNVHTQAVSKMVRKLEFPEDLLMPSNIFYSPNLPKPSDRKYRLSAVVTHIGKEMAGGHYVVDFRARDGDKDFWVTCDDSKVVQANLQGVLRRQAYLLFYTRVVDGT